MPLQVTKLSKRYGNIWALRDVSFEAADGEIFGIFGATGSGKSALLRSIAGTVKTSGGTILHGSDDITALPAKDRRIYLDEGSTASIWSSLVGGSKPSRSDGERQWEAFDKAIQDTNDILLLDDPFTNLDSLLRERCFEKIREVARDKGCIVIFASSDFEQIAAVCQNVAVLVKSRLEQTGAPQEIYETPASAAVAEIAGRNNLITARRISSTKAELPEFQTIDGSHRLFTASAEKRVLGAINQNVNLAIRPEQISMSFGASFPEDNLVKAVVMGFKFLGATSIIEFDAGGLKLEARVFRVVGLNIGDECMLGLPPHRIQILKD